MDTTDPRPPDVTLLLEATGKGDSASSARLLEVVYEQLRKIAQQRMNQERRDHTLQATALVHEAYARLVGSGGAGGDAEPTWANRAHFFAAAAEAMRRILIEHARARGRVKRGGEAGRPAQRVPLDVLDLAECDDPDEIMAVDECVRRLEKEDPSAAAVVRLRFYAGLDVAQTAAALGLSERTVAREWSYARAVLAQSLESE